MIGLGDPRNILVTAAINPRPKIKKKNLDVSWLLRDVKIEKESNNQTYRQIRCYLFNNFITQSASELEGCS